MDYVLVMVKDGQKFLFIEKNRPDWQKNRFNLVGGKVETGETFRDAAFRELYEESGIISERMIEYGSIICGNDEVKVFRAKNNKIPKDFPKVIDGENVFFDYWKNIVENPKLLPQLKTIIPLIHSAVKGWNLYPLEDNSYKIEFK